MANRSENRDVSPKNQHFEAIMLLATFFPLAVWVSGCRSFPQKQKQACFRQAQLMQGHAEAAKTQTRMMPAVMDD